MLKSVEQGSQDLKQQMQADVIAYIDAQDIQGKWKTSAFLTIGGLWNSVTHDNPKQALNLAIWDISRAFEKGVPADVTKLVLEKVYDYSRVLQAERIRKGSKEGRLITRSDLEQNVKKLIGRGKISQDYYNAIFS